MIYLKAADQATFEAALVECGWKWDDEYRVVVDEDGNETTTDEIINEAGMSTFTANHSLDIIGVIQQPTGEMLTHTSEDGATYEYPEMAPIDGYHANLLLHGDELPEALKPLVMTTAPTNPVRRFA